ncbi:MAG: methyl-accepting chemotaxis protein, partial [Acidocella sp.]|nr:methyl-accepting chemotaxis protein [Acidocella sp.]
MADIKQKLTIWSQADQATGDKVYQLVHKNLEAILLKAYQAADPTLRKMPAEALAREEKKFAYIARGNFCDGYFEQQEAISKGLAAKLDYVRYLTGAYAAYAAGLTQTLINEKGWFKGDRDQLIESLMRSVFSDASVVMCHYFDHLSKQAADERAVVEAERERLADEDRLAMEIVSTAMEALANGDLTYRITADMPPRSEALKRHFNVTSEKLQSTMQSIAANTEGVRVSAGEITQSSDDLSRRTEQQAASLEETAAALDQITATVRKTSEGAGEARSVANTAKADAERSGVVVNETVTAMSGIESSSKQISNIIGVIDEIAFQTNLLALNAGVEAARAGDAGRGFAVVATEVRALAQRSADAAKEIKALISTSGAQVETGVKLVGETGHALSRIVAQVERLNTLVTDIAGSAAEQATGLAEVNTAVNQMDQVTQQNAAMVEESTAA